MTATSLSTLFIALGVLLAAAPLAVGAILGHRSKLAQRSAVDESRLLHPAGRPRRRFPDAA